MGPTTVWTCAQECAEHAIERASSRKNRRLQILNALSLLEHLQSNSASCERLIGGDDEDRGRRGWSSHPAGADAVEETGTAAAEEVVSEKTAPDTASAGSTVSSVAEGPMSTSGAVGLAVAAADGPVMPSGSSSSESSPKPQFEQVLYSELLHMSLTVLFFAKTMAS